LRRAIIDSSGRPKKPRTIAASATAVATASSTTTDDIILPDNPSESAIAARNNIINLRRAFRHVASSEYHSILANASLIGFAMYWFSQVSPHHCSILTELHNPTAA
jgi:hypothetical protein